MAEEGTVTAHADPGPAPVPTRPARDAELEALEMELLLEAIHRHYSFDFREYAVGSLRRRLCSSW